MPCFLTISCRDFLLTLRISNEVKADLPVLFLLLLQVLGVYAFIFMFILPVCVVRSFLFILASDTLHCCVLNYMQFKLKNVRHFSHFTIVTLRDYIKMSWHPRPSTAMLTSPLVDHPTTSGNVVRPGRPRERWIDQVRKDNGIPPADLWRRATNRGHRGATLRPSLASH